MNRSVQMPIRCPVFTLSAVAIGVFLLAAAPRAGAEELSKLAGRWTWSWKDPSGTTHEHSLDVEGVGKKLAARERFDQEPAVKVDALTLDGKKVSFSVTRDQKRAEYSGALDGDTIKGVVIITIDGQKSEYPWNATRGTIKKAGGCS